MYCIYINPIYTVTILTTIHHDSNDETTDNKGTSRILLINL